MTAIRLDGKALAQKKQAQLKEEVAQFQAQYHCLPKLVVLLVGEEPASQVYVRNKERVAQAIGFESVVERLDAGISEEELLEKVAAYNQDTTCHGILVQLPLPAHIDEQKVLTRIDAAKDIDGFHPTNVGNFLLGNPSTKPCTPYGIMALLDEYGLDLTGKLAVVIGRSNIVGKPMAQFLLQANATVVMAHSKTKNLQDLTRQADVLVAAIGRGHMITSDYIKPGAIVIDVGMNRNAEGKLIGDVDSHVMEKAAYMTPVPGGVGPMTITMLMQQTLECARRQVAGQA